MKPCGHTTPITEKVTGRGPRASQSNGQWTRQPGLGNASSRSAGASHALSAALTAHPDTLRTPNRCSLLATPQAAHRKPVKRRAGAFGSPAGQLG
jgi:hypothetical protein